MNWYRRVRQWVAGAPETTDPQEMLALLLRAAQQDEALRRQLLFVARAPDWQRESLVNSALEEMARRGESAAARSAFAVLITPGGAAAVRQVLGAA